MWAILASAIEWVISLFITRAKATHDQQMQAMGQLQQSKADYEASLKAQQNIAAADAAAPKTESELDAKLKDGSA